MVIAALDTTVGWQFDLVVMLPVLALLVLVGAPIWMWARDRHFNLDESAGRSAARPVVSSCDHPSVYDWAKDAAL